MEILWCWRCKMNIPMLDEDEFANVIQLLYDGSKATEDHRREQDLLSADKPIRRGQAALEEYERLTRFRETNPTALWHHRISIYGPPCRRCGKVLRTPIASKCFECGLSAVS